MLTPHPQMTKPHIPVYLRAGCRCTQDGRDDLRKVLGVFGKGHGSSGTFGKVWFCQMMPWNSRDGKLGWEMLLG